jgi:hypothetical protein
LRSSNLACRLALGACAVTVVAALAACGSSSTKPSKLSLSISEQGKKASFTVPKSAKGGLVDLTFANKGKAPHGVQFVQYTGNHTAGDVLKQIGSGGNKIPSWIKGNGGTPSVPGGKTETATLNLPAGNYIVIDTASSGGPSSGPPTTAQMKLTSGDTGGLPSTPATVSANKTGKDKYAWNISGLKAGSNEITFNSKGSGALHLIGAIPVKGKAPSLNKLRSDFAKFGNGPPPPYVGGAPQTTAILDGGESQTLTLNLKPGQYIFFCPLKDRDGGKSHDQEGLLKTVTVK